jgi:hypothetical protein
MYIQLEEGIGMVTGQFIRGVVHVNQIKPFKASEITIGLHGEEFVQFQKLDSNKNPITLSAKKEIINLVLPITNWND